MNLIILYIAWLAFIAIVFTLIGRAIIRWTLK